MAAWGHFLADIPSDILSGVVEAWVRKESRAPSIADLLERVAALDGDDAESAWKEVMSLVTTGQYRDRTQMGSPVKDVGWTKNPAMEAAVKETGGWAALGAADAKALVWAKKEFIAAYARQAEKRIMQIALAVGARKELADGRSRDSSITGEE
jgi:hypothetical protein